MRSRSEMMVDKLRDLESGTPAIEASAVVSVDGLIMASALPDSYDGDRISAMSAAILSLGERIADELARGRLDKVYIAGDDGFIVLMAVKRPPQPGQTESEVEPEAVLTVLASPKARLGLIFHEMKRAVPELGKLL